MHEIDAFSSSFGGAPVSLNLSQEILFPMEGPSMSNDLYQPFMLGLRGLPLDATEEPANYAVVVTAEDQGPIEQLFISLGSVPAFSNSEEAYEGGRRLRMAGFILDRSNVTMGDAQRFLKRLTHSMLCRDVASPPSGWSASEMCCILKSLEIVLPVLWPDVEQSLQGYAKDRPGSQVYNLTRP